MDGSTSKSGIEMHLDPRGFSKSSPGGCGAYTEAGQKLVSIPRRPLAADRWRRFHQRRCDVVRGGGGAHWCAGVSLIEDDGPDTDNSAPWGWSRRRFGVVWWAKRLARHKRRQRSDTTGEAETSADPQSRSRWSPWVTGRYTSHRNSNSADAAHNRACSSLQNQECCCFYFIAISPIRPHPHPKKTHRLTMCWLWKTSTCFVLGFFFFPHLTNSVTAHTYIRDGRECEKKSFSLRWKNVILSFMQMKNKAECLTVR